MLLLLYCSSPVLQAVSKHPYKLCYGKTSVPVITTFLGFYSKAEQGYASMGEVQMPQENAHRARRHCTALYAKPPTDATPLRRNTTARQAVRVSKQRRFPRPSRC